MRRRFRLVVFITIAAVVVLIGNAAVLAALRRLEAKGEPPYPLQITLIWTDQASLSCPLTVCSRILLHLQLSVMTGAVYLWMDVLRMRELSVRYRSWLGYLAIDLPPPAAIASTLAGQLLLVVTTLDRLQGLRHPLTYLALDKRRRARRAVVLVYSVCFSLCFLGLMPHFQVHLSLF